MADTNQKAGRAAFDDWMKKFGHKRLLSVLDIEQIKRSTHYTLRRLAYWVRDQSKIIAKECMEFFKNNGIIGNKRAQLSVQHFA